MPNLVKVDVCQENIQSGIDWVPVDTELVGTAIVAVLTPVVGVEPRW